MEEHIYDLITDYLTGEISPDDRARLCEWVEESEKNKAILERFREVWIGADQVACKYDPEEAFRKFQRRTLHKSDTPKFKWEKKAKEYKKEIYRWAAAIFMPIVITSAVLAYLQVGNYLDGQTIVSTIEGQSTTFQLPDGTTVNLQQNSELSYSSVSFIRGNRDITFHGEAYFKVESDEAHPFNITTSHTKVSVVGTEFNLRSRDGEKFGTLTLDKGKVQLTSLADKSSVKMTAGDVVTVNRDTKKIECRHRTAEEIERNIQERLAAQQEHSIAVQDINSIDNGYKMTLVVNKPLTPGTYEMDFNTKDEKMNICGADTEGNAIRGYGTAAHPYRLSTAAQMCKMKELLTPNKMTYFVLDNDIDLSGIDWQPLNTAADNYANWIHFDGKKHVIRHLTPSISSSYSSFFGVFCGVCKNVGFEDVNISSTGNGAGVLGGYLGHKTYKCVTRIENCYFTGRVSSKSYAGGIGGNIGGSTVIRNCFSSVDVTSVSSYAGGLIGKIKAKLVMEQCLCAGSVAAQYAGGIVGGGQDEETPPSEFRDVYACNRSVYGSIDSDSFGKTAESDKLRNTGHCSGMFLNGKSMTDGMQYSSIQSHVCKWPKAWYKREAGL